MNIIIIKIKQNCAQTSSMNTLQDDQKEKIFLLFIFFIQYDVSYTVFVALSAKPEYEISDG